MTRRLLLLTVVTALTVIACIAMPLIPATVQPVDATSLGGTDPAMEVLPSSAGLPMPPGLHAGDKMYLSDMSPATRSFFMVGGSNPPRGTVIDLPVRNADGSVHHVPVQFLPTGFLNGNPVNMLIQLAGYALTLLAAALGLLLLWRGRSQAAFGVALWCFAFFQQALLSTIPLPVPYGNIVNWIGSTLDTLGTLIGLYLIADGLTRDARPAARRRRAHWIFGGVIVLYDIGLVVFNGHFYLYGNFDMPVLNSYGLSGVIAMHFAAFMIPLTIMGIAYKRCDAVNQARIKWVLFSLVGLLLSYVLGLLAGRLDLPIFIVNIIATMLVASAFVGFAYAVLKHQLVSLQVVLNRALVYGLLTSLVVGVFAAMLSFLEHETLNTETNRVLALLVPLILGMGLDTVKRQVNSYIGKIFFRRRHEAEAALAQFARTCGHVDDPEKLLDLTADELYRQGGPQCLAIYLTSPQTSGATQARQRGDGSCPKRLDNNDLAFLRLKAGDAEVNLPGVGSKLGQEGLVYGLQVRSQLLGCIYLGPRPAEAYSAEERQLFEKVAHQVAVALHALRLEAQRKLLEELADGAFGTPASLQTKVRELIGVGG